MAAAGRAINVKIIPGRDGYGARRLRSGVRADADACVDVGAAAAYGCRADAHGRRAGGSERIAVRDLERLKAPQAASRALDFEVVLAAGDGRGFQAAEER